MVQTSVSREPIDLSHLVFSVGEIGRLQTLSTTTVLAGDSFSQDLVGALNLSPLRRGLTADSVVDVYTFYVPHRHVYGEEWINFVKQGTQATPLAKTHVWPAGHVFKTAHLGLNIPEKNAPATLTTPAWLLDGYQEIYDAYFKIPYKPLVSHGPTNIGDRTGRYGFAVSNLKNIWTAPLPPERGRREWSSEIEDNRAVVNLQALNQGYAELHTEQERELFGQRYRDIIGINGGKVNVDADNRPTLLMRSTQWASGYDVDGTDQTSLGQHTGRVSQVLNHKVPRFFCAEHGTIWTMATVRFPPSHTNEVDYLALKPNPTYHEIMGDSALALNSPPIEVDVTNFFPNAVASLPWKIASNQWFRYQADRVHPLYAGLEGYPFQSKIPATDDEQMYVKSYDYQSMFQTTQLAHWNVQARNNVTVHRILPSARDAIMTNT